MHGRIPEKSEGRSKCRSEEVIYASNYLCSVLLFRGKQVQYSTRAAVLWKRYTVWSSVSSYLDCWGISARIQGLGANHQDWTQGWGRNCHHPYLQGLNIFNRRQLCEGPLRSIEKWLSFSPIQRERRKLLAKIPLNQERSHPLHSCCLVGEKR